MKRIGMVVYSYYPGDPRVAREALALVEAGFQVDVICLRGEKQSRCEEVDGVRVFRLNMERDRGSKFRYFWSYFSFLLRAMLRLSANQLAKRYAVVHIHNMPDILVLSGLLPKMMGAKIVLDLHDPMPEVFIAKYGVAESHPLIRMLIRLERFSIHFAHLALTPNLAFKQRFIERGCPQEKMHIVMNSPVEAIFDAGKYPAENNSGEEASFVEPFIVMYHGSIVHRHGLDDAVKAIASLRNHIPGLRFHVFGSGEFVETFRKVVEIEAAQDLVVFFGDVNLQRIAREISRINLGIIPNKSNPFTDINLPTRIFEYLAMNKPVVACRTRGIQDYFGEAELVFFQPGDAGDLARAILAVYRDEQQTRQTLEQGIAVFRNYAWKRQKQQLVSLIKRLLGEPLPPQDGEPEEVREAAEDIGRIQPG